MNALQLITFVSCILAADTYLFGNVCDIDVDSSNGVLDPSCRSGTVTIRSTSKVAYIRFSNVGRICIHSISGLTVTDVLTNQDLSNVPCERQTVGDVVLHVQVRIPYSRGSFHYTIS
ncbi:uncharacterized protein LOC123555629 [Mercenaria mercenaria]|uniref:uncharacterized protein LOC123555629 n=1 Tax=Mercenaria mercenaria TaxID=6596 RepID=UPI00234F9733|nr:uncharacterized protein LOC123555629 [Mercenaria mercenaria]